MIYKMVNGGLIRQSDLAEKYLSEAIKDLNKKGYSVKKVTPIAGDGSVAFFIEASPKKIKK